MFVLYYLLYLFSLLKFKSKKTFFLNLEIINRGGYLITAASVNVLTEAGGLGRLRQVLTEAVV